MQLPRDDTIDSMQTVPRLIKQFKPTNYNLTLDLNRPKRTFTGIVIIDGVISKKSNTITLHSKDLVVNSATIDGELAEFSYAENDALIITLPNISKGKHQIEIKFIGKINDSMHGMYPCYFEHDGVKKELIATQFESHHAREVFPCVDEPAAKAIYDVTLKTETNATVLGNMPIKSQTTSGKKLITTFDTTPIMSSYLLAWVVGELHKKTAHTKSGVEVNVWATPAQPASSLDFALDIATRSIDFFDEYFGISYPLPKCDHVALPDFSSGAMENWGLITYREIALLADPKTTSISSKRYIATVITHELSHQWFGNLVTMEWWNDLWLNESFASLVEYDAVDALQPDWNIWLDFASYESIYALRRDSLAGVQSVQTDVNHPDEIGVLFDGAIVYIKGARLIQMLRTYIGQDAFRAGLKKYFKKHAYKNATASDLWAMFSEVSAKDIESLMSAWISQPGFPILHVAKDNNKITLSQNRLTSLSTEPSDTLWPITLNSNSLDMPKLLEAREVTIISNDEQPIRFNVGNNAHFITHYSDDLLDQIITELKNNNLDPIDRLQLLNEQTLLANAGVISNAGIIPILSVLNNEDNEAVWGIIGSTIGELKKYIEHDEEIEQKLRDLTYSLAVKQYERLGWNQSTDESEEDTKLRSIITKLMIYSENPDVLSAALAIYPSMAIHELPPETRHTILSAAVKHANDNKIIDELIGIYKSSSSAELKQDICIALTNTKNSEVIELIFELIKDSETIRTQDTFRWFAYMMRNKYSRDYAWNWLRNNWDWIEETFGNDKSYDDYPRFASGTLSTPEQFEEFKEFFVPMRSNTALTRAVDIGINEIKDRIDAIERDKQLVREALMNL